VNWKSGGVGSTFRGSLTLLPRYAVIQRLRLRPCCEAGIRQRRTGWYRGVDYGGGCGLRSLTGPLDVFMAWGWSGRGTRRKGLDGSRTSLGLGPPALMDSWNPCLTPVVCDPTGSFPNLGWNPASTSEGDSSKLRLDLRSW